jgi:hypothetical protein
MKPLTDATAIQILKTIAKTQLHQEHPNLTQTPALQAALAATFGTPPPIPTTEGDLARAALDLLAQDPAFTNPIQTMAQHPSPERYLDHATITLTTAALLVLMTRIKAKLDNTGKWSIEIDKKAASDSLLKLLVQRFLSLPPK